MIFKYFVRTTLNEKSKSPVQIRIRVREGRDVDLYARSEISVSCEKWKQKKQAAEGYNTDPVNNKLRELKRFIEDEFLNISNSKVDKEWLRETVDKFHNPDRYSSNAFKSLFEFMQDFIDRSSQRKNPKTGQTLNYRVIREYHITFNYIKDFAMLKHAKKHSNKVPETDTEIEEYQKKHSKSINKMIDFKDIDLDFYEGFIQFLEAKNLCLNTVGKKIKTLKVFLNDATERGINSHLMYKSTKFLTLTEKPDTIYLNKDELQRIADLDFSKKPYLDRVRDVFLVGCWTGCRFGDIAQVSQKNIQGDYITMSQQKTGERVVIPIHPVVKGILNKYDGELPHLITNQRFNEWIKKVGKLAKIKDPVINTQTRGGKKVTEAFPKYNLISSHTARRSFATNLYKEGFPTLSIMKITGHKTEAAFLLYIRVTPEEHAIKLMDFWNSKRDHLKVV